MSSTIKIIMYCVHEVIGSPIEDSEEVKGFRVNELKPG